MHVGSARNDARIYVCAVSAHLHKPQANMKGQQERYTCVLYLHKLQANMKGQQETIHGYTCVLYLYKPQANITVYVCIVYMCFRMFGICLASNFVFRHSLGQLPMHKFVTAGSSEMLMHTIVTAGSTEMLMHTFVTAGSIEMLIHTFVTAN